MEYLYNLMSEFLLIFINASFTGILIAVAYYYLFILKVWKKSNELYLLNSKKNISLILTKNIMGNVCS